MSLTEIRNEQADAVCIFQQFNFRQKIRKIRNNVRPRQEELL